MKKFNIIFSALLLVALASCNKNQPVQPEYTKGTATTTVGKALMENTDLVASMFSDTQKTITSGLDLYGVHFLGSDGKAVRMWFLRADLKNPNISLDQTWAGDGFGSTKQVLTQIASEKTTDENFIWAATNADFFSNTTPQGVFIHEQMDFKTEFDETPVRPRCFFYTFKNEEDKTRFCIKDASEWEDIYYTIWMDEAAGGGPLLVKDGFVLDVPAQSDGLTDRNPRTCIGVEKDSTTVWVMVADGRRYTWSNGLQFPEASKIMKAVGCQNVMNLDGGGSSEMIIRADETNKFNVVNWPADNAGTERELCSCIYFATKQL